MKLLFIGFNRIYLNRTFFVQLQAIAACHDIKFYGPGFVDGTALLEGPMAWAEKNGPFEFVLFDSYLAEFETIAERKKPFLYDQLNFTKSDFYTFGPKMAEFILEYDSQKVFIANCDIYNVRRSWIDNLLDRGWYVVDSSFVELTVAEKMEKSKINVPIRNMPSFSGGLATDHWLELLQEAPEKIIKIPHSIGLEQVSYIPLRCRKERFSVPGARYGERLGVYPFLSPRSKYDKLISRIRNKAHFKFSSSLSECKRLEMNRRYDQEISSARFVYVSGSMYMHPLRKYFEVPALGAVPIGPVCEAFENLGFKDRESFIIAETKEDVLEVLRDIQIQRAQEIALKAQSMVLQAHGYIARSRQFQETFQRISKRSFRGSFWQDGVYNLI